MNSFGGRQSTLLQMGISQWYSRCKLQGAADTPGYFQTVDVNTHKKEHSSSADKANASISDMRRPTASALDILQKTPEANALPTPETSSNISTSNELSVPAITSRITEPLLPVSSEDILAASGKPLPDVFKLKLYRANQLIIFSEERAEAGEQQELALLNNILRMTSLTTDHSDKCQYLGEFTWPIFKAIPSANESCARLLTRWISSHVQREDEAYLFFGDAQILANSFCHDVVVSKVDRSSGITSISFPNSLSELLVLPSLKIKVWEKMIESELVE